MRQYYNKLTELIQGRTSWGELKYELSKYNIDNRETKTKDTSAGKIFEVFAKYYFLCVPELKGDYQNVWLYDEIPFLIKESLKLGNVEYGIDLLLETYDKRFYAVQCKFKNDETSKLNWSADKIANLFAYCPDADGYIVFSNAATLDKVSLTRQENFTFYTIGHLLEVERQTFSNIHKLLIGLEPEERTYFDPKPHQQKAIVKSVQSFTEGEKRGQLILPCGAGKTFTSLWIKERLESRKTLVLVPSLALLRQIKNEWAKQRRTDYIYLCVCSEKDIDKENYDSIVNHAFEIGGNVTTDPNEIKRFLKLVKKERVIFSTYQSLPAIAEAIRDIDFEFEFVFCDEAHKTAGINKGVFGLIHDNDKIPAQKRLYATATPRIVKESIKKKLSDNLKFTHDMNDTETFGKEFYRMSFKEAIENKILVDYKIVAIGVKDIELAKYIQERWLIQNGISIDEVANNYALDNVMNKYEANHALTFHSRVKLSQQFSARHSSLYKSISTYTVDGTQPTSLRNQIFKDYEIANTAVLSNARCLTEGVDIPAIDLVFFCDPKNSKIDIIQAAGRALRRKTGKKYGLIVVPIYHSVDQDIEDLIKTSVYRNLIQVIRALCDQDERLQDEINLIAYRKSPKKIGSNGDTSIYDQDIIQFIGFEEVLIESIFAQIIDKNTDNWEVNFLNLKNYQEIFNKFPEGKEDKHLSYWVANQRTSYRNNLLTNAQIEKLNSIDFVWDQKDAAWLKMYNNLYDFSKNSDFEPEVKDYRHLSNWFQEQKIRVKYGLIKKIFKEKLELIKFKNTTLDISIHDEEWEKTYLKIVSFQKSHDVLSLKESPVLNHWFKEQNELLRLGDLTPIKKIHLEVLSLKSEDEHDHESWEELYERLKIFREINPNKWPTSGLKNSNSMNEIELGNWCNYLRIKYKSGDLEKSWITKLNDIDFNLSGRKDKWIAICNKVAEYIKQNNKLPDSDSEFYPWSNEQIRKYRQDKLSKEKRNLLNDINFFSLIKDWSDKFSELEQWVIENGKIPTRNDHKEFYSWLNSQRSRYKNGHLTETEISKLKSIEFDLVGLGKERDEENWLNQFNNLKKYIEQIGKYPSKGDNKSLYLWVQNQRAVKSGSARNRKPLSSKREALLDSIDFKWVVKNGLNDTWQENLNELGNHIKPHGIIIPAFIEGKRNTLYTWWANQKYAYANGKLSDEKIQAFRDIGIELGNVIRNSEKDDNIH